MSFSHTHLRWFLLFFILGLSSTGTSGVETSPQSSERLDNALINFIKDNDIDESKIVGVNVRRLTLHHTNRSLESAKFIDSQTNQSYTITFDEQGNPVELAPLLLNERAARRQLTGVIEPSLATKLQSRANSDTRLPVTIHVKMHQPATPPILQLADQFHDPDTGFVDLRSAASGMSDVEVDEFIRTTRLEQRQRLQREIQPLAARLATLGIDVSPLQYSPSVHTFLSGPQAQQISRWPDVAQITSPYFYLPQLDVAGPNVGSWRAHTIYNATGKNIKVAVVEVGGLIEVANPYLGTVVQDKRFVCQDVCQPRCHSTAIAGVINSRHPVYRGIAPDATVWAGGSCAGVSNEIKLSAAAALNWGADVINMSIGAYSGDHLDDLDSYVDQLSWSNVITIVAAAGNKRLGVDDVFITSPGKAYNTVTVGAFLQGFNFSWDDDDVHPGSLAGDPFSLYGDREEPEMVAPGMQMLGPSAHPPWLSYASGGSSLAAAVVTGTVGLMLQKDPALRILQPPAVRAILLATAVNNIEGSRRLSERDGAGGVVTERAVQVAGDVYGTWGAVLPFGNQERLILKEPAYYKGLRVRVAVSWVVDPFSESYPDLPPTDYDLHVRDPAGKYVASSTSYDNNYEIVDFVPEVTGKYQLELRASRIERYQTWVAWAYHFVYPHERTFGGGGAPRR